jgi:hypothetical protein
MSALQVMLAGKVGPRALAGSFFVSPATDPQTSLNRSATQRDSDLRTDFDDAEADEWRVGVRVIDRDAVQGLLL